MATLNAGFDIRPDLARMDFAYGPGVFGPPAEKRHLDDIRQSLSDPTVQGPDVVYSVAMDVGREEDRADLLARNLLFGAMIYRRGRMGEEPVRSQGHIHAVSPSCGTSTCEVYEIWQGSAYVYMQETAEDDPGRCFAVHAKAGDVVIVPPAWAHATINADPTQEMLFGAWCVRDYGFDYVGVRAHHGIAWFPKLRGDDVEFVPNPRYQARGITVKEARDYPDFGLARGVPIYEQYERDRDLFGFVTRPQVAEGLWRSYEP